MKSNLDTKKNRHHFFCVEEAERYGIKEAILLANIRHWLDKNKANKTNIQDGRVWTYNSRSAFAELFPYMSEKQIRIALNKLIEAGILLTGNYNKSAYDRTLWYSIDEPEYRADADAIFSESNGPNGQIDLPKRSVPFAPEGQPIPDINTDINADSKPNINGASAPKDDSGLLEKMIGQWNSTFDVQVRSTDKKRRQLRARLRTFTIPEIATAMANRARDPWLQREGIKHRGDWDSFFRNDEKIERYLNAKHFEEDDSGPLF